MKKKNLLQVLTGILMASVIVTSAVAPVRAEELTGLELESTQGTEIVEETERTEEPENADLLRQELQQILETKTVMATVYLTDVYEVYEEPEYHGQITGELPSGSQVFILDAWIGASDIWYYVVFAMEAQERYGYIEASNLVSSDMDLRNWESSIHTINEEHLLYGNGGTSEDILAFPESYRASLTQLKTAHPNWTFVPIQTNLEWNSVVAVELQNDRSWVYETKGSGWKAGAASQSGWYVASQSAVEYCLDPRNFTNESYIFMFEQLTYNAQYHTVDAVASIVSGSFMQGEVPGEGVTYAQAFYNIGNSLGVSPYHLACRVYQEQGSDGTSPLISGNYAGYEGYYNYYNIGASGTTTTDAYINGLETAKKNGWNTRLKALAGGAEYLSLNYILKGQDTLYLQKFDVDDSYHGLYSHQYQQNITAPMTEGAKIRKAYEQANALDNPFVFKIPVYNNMPSSACPSPDSQSNADTTASTGIRSFVQRLYEDVLGRTSYQESEIDGWYNALCNGEKTGAEVAQGFFFSEEFKNKNPSDEVYVDLLYRVMFDRQAEDGGKEYWLAKLSAGMSREYIYHGFANSQEFANVCGQYGVIQGSVSLGAYRDQNEGVTAFVNRLYVKLLDRQGEDTGIEGWCKIILTGEDNAGNVAYGFVFSQEFANRNTSNEEFVKIMYRTFLDREYDQAGLEGWVAQLNAGVGREQVFRGFADSVEFHNLMKEYGV